MIKLNAKLTAKLNANLDTKCDTVMLTEAVNHIDIGWSRYAKGVKAYAADIIDNYADLNNTVSLPPLQQLEKALLVGEQDWAQYSNNIYAHVTSDDIANRLLTPSEQRKPLRQPRDLQTDALRQAMLIIRLAYRQLRN